MAYSIELFGSEANKNKIDPYLRNVIIMASVQGENIEKMQKEVVVILKDENDLPALKKIVTPDLYGVNGKCISVTVSIPLLAAIASLDCVEQIGW